MQINIPIPLTRGVASLFLAAVVAGGCGTVSKDTETNGTVDASDTDTSNDTGSETDTSAGSESSESDSGDTDFPNCPDGSVAPGSGENLMEKYGRPCEADSDCDDLGEDAQCVKTILEVAHAPAGYCSRDCDLPDGNTKYDENHRTTEQTQTIREHTSDRSCAVGDPKCVAKRCSSSGSNPNIRLYRHSHPNLPNSQRKSSAHHKSTGSP